MPERATTWRVQTLTAPLAQAWRVRRPWWAVLGIAATGAMAWFGAPLLMSYVPHWPERLPVPMQAWLAQRQPEPDWAALPLGPVLRDAQRNGELVVAVRAYARPAPPGAPAPMEPDHFDAEFAATLAQRLQLKLRLVNLLADGRLPQDAHVDVIVAGSQPAPAAWQPVPTAYTGGQGALVVLRNAPYRSVADLRARTVCVARGSPYASGLAARYGAIPQQYPSAIRAIWGFLSGECQALADDAQALARLMQVPEWRFYRTLEDDIAPDNTAAQIALRTLDVASANYVDRAVRVWKTGGALARARTQRAGDIAFEVSQLQDGLVCHN
ncbi:transporter substrate-binding domain-containing protein [Ralstonia pickettii]|uniref:Transporter substrate-binding domain-containing protein n=1 Tax=Ralstonia pickettii TaxID=329 RepID=A0A7X2L949_RALPI|nr:transporter substrate-binding domain-containing protein [Ralstonia pickettii]MRS97581.1 transporter substrate-binding domain-containing protein [Ralstonia pickettii]